jgi:hypothetical protein
MNELCFSVFFPGEGERLDMIMIMNKEGNDWSGPNVADFSGEFNDNWPWYSPDGDRIYFSSMRPIDLDRTEENNRYGLWCVERKDSGWSDPMPIVSPADFGRDEGPIYVAAELPGGFGDMDIYKLSYEAGSYSMPRNSGSEINTAAQEYGPCVAADESFLIFNRYEESEGGRSVDMYISFKNSGGVWSPALNMADKVGAFRGARFPGLSPDGRYLFYVAENGKAVHWVSIDALELYRSDD